MGTKTTSTAGDTLRRWADRHGKALISDDNPDDSVLAFVVIELAETIAGVCDDHRFGIPEARKLVGAMSAKAAGLHDTDRVVMLGMIRNALAEPGQPEGAR